jgi:hypothetical protein
MIQRVTVALGLLATLAIPVNMFADVIHFYNGSLMRGKLEHVDGDILEFHSGGVFGSSQNVSRLHLSNRHDLVETLGHHTYYGEIVYMDTFQVDLKTTAGILKINRWKVRNIVAGTPMQQPSLPPNAAANAFHTIALPGQDNNTSSAVMPAVSDTDDSTPALRGRSPEGNDDLAIPAVDQTP